MTHDEEVAELIHIIIQCAVQRSGGDWKRSYRHEVERILALTTGSPPPKEAHPLDVCECVIPERDACASRSFPTGCYFASPQETS
jgi:hypothetical protein